VATHHLNALTVTLRAYSGHPLAGDLAEAFSMSVSVDAELDLDEVADEIRHNVAPPRVISQTYRETTWGASGSGAQFVVDVLGGAASLITIWDKVAAGAHRHVKTRSHHSATPAESARAAMAASLDAARGEIRVTGLEATEAGHRVRLETPHGNFTVDVAGSGVTRISRSR
jgi:hypothetical protein